MSRTVSAVLVMLAALISQPASVWAADETRFSFRGFGTLGMAYSRNGDAGFLRDITQPDGVRNRVNFDADSRLGLQLDAELLDSLDATVQLISRYGYDGSYRPELAWGFLRYTPQPDLEIRAGRLGWDVYILSASRDVGYSYLWVRPPVEYYGHLQLSKINGVDAVVRRPVGDGVLSTKLFAGEVESKAPLNKDSYADLGGSRLYGGYLDYQTTAWQFRLGMTRLALSTELRGELGRQLQSLRDILPPELAGRLDGANRDSRFHFYTAGIAYDRGPVQAQLMYSYIDSEASHPDLSTGYVSVGYRFGRWTPYVTYSVLEATSDSSAQSPASGLVGIPGLEEVFAGRDDINQYTVAAGARFSLSPSVALKFQVDRVRVKAPGGGNQILLWNQPAADWSGRTTVFSTTLDFVF